ncbi:MAG: photosystem q(b) protein, partial [Cyanobacteriota bacterium]
MRQGGFPACPSFPLNNEPDWAWLLSTTYPVLMTTTIQQRQGASAWNQFCEWVTSTDNRLYVGW